MINLWDKNKNIEFLKINNQFWNRTEIELKFEEYVFDSRRREAN